ncbi:hypothetical protein LINPERHAP2_LOCUS12106 [Linum perenne]
MEHPWILSRDFNAMLRQDDKRGGAQFSLTQNQPFIDCCNVCGLSETSFFGPKFTWHRGGTSERLDRALTNEEWRVKFPFTKTRHLSRVYSDHRPILTACEDIDRVRLSRPFRFVAAWLGHDSFQSNLNDACGGGGGGGGRSSDLSVKLEKLMPKLKKWNREIFGNIFRRKKLLEERMEALELQQDLNPSVDTHAEENATRAELERTLWEEELIWIQKARCKWVIEADRNTSYYHKSTLRRRAFNRITRLKNDELDPVSQQNPSCPYP